MPTIPKTAPKTSATAPKVSADSETFLTGPPADAKLRQIGTHVLTELAASALKVLAHEANPSEFPLSEDDPLEKAFAARFAAKPAPARAAAARRAAAIAANPGASGTIGGLQLVNFKAVEPVSAQLAQQRPSVSMTVDELTHAVSLAPLASSLTHIGLSDDDEPEASIPPTTAGAHAHPHLHLDPAVISHLTKKPKSNAMNLAPFVYRGVELRLIKMACVETTSGGGADQISLAGITISGNGATRKIDPFMVSDNFDSGEAVQFGLNVTGPVTNLQWSNTGPMIFTKFAYKADDKVTVNGKTYKVDWPRAYWVTFLLAEIDNGGFPEFVDDIYNQVKDKVISAVAAAVGAAIGATALSEIPGLGTAVGAAVGALVGWIIGELWGAFKELWEDDEFTPISVCVKRKSSWSRFKNETAFDSKNQVVWWKQMGGEYRLKFDWKVYGGLAPAQ
jgi:hypothetical protein